MTKKDYVLIAEAIRQAREARVDESMTWMADRIVDNLIDSLYRNNQRFDARRFREATEI